MEAASIRRSKSRSNIETPADLPKPNPHLPLRKSSAYHLQTKSRSTPTPLFLDSSHFNQVRGFNPSPVQPVPRVDSLRASSEHAFAGREVRRPAHLPLRELENRGVTLQAVRYSSTEERGKRPPSSPLVPPPLPDSPDLSTFPRERELKSARSVSSGLKGFSTRTSNISSYETPTSARSPGYSVSRPSLSTFDATRDSYRSAATRASSFAHSGVYTERSSSMTGHSSTSDFVKVQPEDWQDMDMSVEDAIGMYENGFESNDDDLDAKSCVDLHRTSTDSFTAVPLERPLSQPRPQDADLKRPFAAHRRSQSASMLLGISSGVDSPALPSSARHSATESSMAKVLPVLPPTPTIQTSVAGPVPRDRYGFKKASQYVTIEQYDAWDAQYKEYLHRRTAKWHQMMQAYGYSTSKVIRFPPKNDKIKRYIRKGIPLEFRGAAWFWYAGGPSKLKQDPGLYRRLLDQIDKGELSDNDREHIERDLNRTFPDNIRFKPDPTSMNDAQAGAGGGQRSSQNGKQRNTYRSEIEEPETPIIAALRRVLQAFAVHNPHIGYCQSLNFIAGLLLLFLDEDEEKSFILLNTVTSLHLPGTHGVALEGANVDIAVLMSCIKDSLPAVWAKLDDKPALAALMPSNHASTVGPSAAGSASALRLPTVSLATTAWFMSLFVGTLPIECVLRVWDCLFFEGSKTLFRVALAIFKFGEPGILAVSDPMEIFQVVQTLPRGLLDVNALMEVCFRRRAGFGGVSQGLIEARRQERRVLVKGKTGEVDDGRVGKKLKEKWKRGTTVR